MYYDLSKTLSYNALFNFVAGNRGCGKTYGAKHWAIRDFIKTGAQFVYVRRYKQELKKNNKFFQDISAAFPDHTFGVQGSTYMIDGRPAGTAIALSTSKIEKSTPYPEVNKMIFDEFIIDKGTYHYLPDEVINFLELYETVARMRDVRVLFLSNAITQTNPYFLYFDIRQPRSGSIFRRGDLLFELVGNEEFIAAKSKTRFGQLIAGTAYGDYAINNKFLRDSDTFIERKPGTAQYLFTFKYLGELFGVWQDYNLGKLWVSQDTDPSCRIVYTITLDDHTPNTMLLKTVNRSPVFKTLIENYKLGVVYFENMKVKNIVYEVIRLAML